MTKATLEIPFETTAKTGRTSVLYSFWALFAMTVGRQALSKRLIVMAVLYVLPIVFTLLIRYNDSGFQGPHAGYDPKFCEFIIIFALIPQALVPFTALVYSSGLIQDEMEEQTITYLLIRPLPRWSVFVAKLLATMVVTIALTTVFTAITFVVIGWGQADYWSSGGWERMLKTIALYALSLAAYDTLFAFLSLLLKRALLVGIAYILVLEGVMAYVDFVIRKITVMYYFRILCERWMHLSDLWPAQGQGRFTYNIDMLLAPSLLSCLITLFAAILAVMIFSGLIMESREFRVKTPEGN